MIQFPKSFLWGSATSSYQVEGGNANADWWPWEKSAGKEPSAAACRHYELYEQDFDLIKGLKHNAHRLSIEWSRIEPQEGNFSQKELQHYVDVILALRARGIEPVVTLHHFTNPIWFSTSEGWEKRNSVDRFLRYCDVVVRALAKHVHFWITINEPTIVASHAYLFGAWPPQAKSYRRAKTVLDNFARAHVASYRRIHAIYKELDCSTPAVSISHHIAAIVPCTSALRDRLASFLRDKWYNFDLLDDLARQNTLDFIGLNYYSRHLVHLKKWGIGNLVWDVCQEKHFPLKKNSLGWDIYPEGLYQVLLKLKKYKVPVMVTENGICTSDDKQRWDYLREHLKSVHRAMQEGVPVTGYLYWSLMDNFEWDKGFGPRFGLIEVDYADGKRTIRESARKFAQVCQTGVLE